MLSMDPFFKWSSSCQRRSLILNFISCQRYLICDLQAILLQLQTVERSQFSDHDLLIHRGTETVGDVSTSKPYRTLDGWIHRQLKLLVAGCFVDWFACLIVHSWWSSICLCWCCLIFDHWNVILIDLIKLEKARKWKTKSFYGIPKCTKALYSGRSDWQKKFIRLKVGMI